MNDFYNPVEEPGPTLHDPAHRNPCPEADPTPMASHNRKARRAILTEPQMPAHVTDRLTRIVDCWERGPQGLLHLAAECTEANELSKTLKRQLVAELPFSRSYFYMLAKVGGDKRLTRLKAVLPENVPALYEPPTSDKALVTFKDEGHLSSTVRREEVSRWRKSYSDEDAELPDAFYVALKLKRQLSTTEGEEVDQTLESLAAKFDIDVVHPADPAPDKSWDNAIRYMRREAKKIVRAWVKRRKAHPRLMRLKANLICGNTLDILPMTWRSRPMRITSAFEMFFVNWAANRTSFEFAKMHATGSVSENPRSCQLGHE